MMRSKLYIRLLAIISVMLVSACDNLIYEGEGDCTTLYQLSFTYDYNMKFADAFPHEVKSVSAYLFDESGTLVYTKSEQVNQDKRDYKMVLDVQPGKYDVLTWCGIEGADCYQVPEAVVGQTTKQELTCWLNREDRNGEKVVDDQLPSLFYGKADEVVFSSHSGIYTENIRLMKNTNVVNLVLQQLSGEPVDASLFDFRITDDNGFMNWDNSLLPDDRLTYLPWSVSQGTAGLDESPEAAVNARTTTVASVALAEFTINRLVKGHDCRLTVFNKQKGEKVLSIPLIDYGLLVKGNYNREMGEQEYLDRQDVYNLTFFLDADYHWASAVIYINSWRVVLHDVEFD